jgi:amidase
LSHSCSTNSNVPLVDLITASIKTLAEDLSACRYSSSDLVRWYLNRINDVNRQGRYPLYAVIETNPDALNIADALDQERRINGSRSLLHGIPILVKDNIATDDKMETTAGSLALVGSRVPRDAFIVEKLRRSGAIIFGKTSLSEWSNIKTQNASREGWSARGGLPR